MYFCLYYLFILVSLCDAHSWLDCLDHNLNVSRAIAPDYDWVFNALSKKGVCEGYARDYPSRAYPDINLPYFHGGFTKFFYPGQNVPLCPSLPGSVYGGWLHELHAVPGDSIFFGYTSNGHVGSDFSAVDTNISIYWSSKAGTTLMESFDLTSERLLVQVPFMDGVCGETVNSLGEKTNFSGINVPCVQNFTIPDTPPGQYSFVWHWKDKNNVVYWSCFDVDIGLPPSSSPSSSLSPTSSPSPSPSPSPPTPYKKS